MRLVDAPLGRPLVVLTIAPSKPARASRLAAMGIVGGVSLMVRQRRPALIVEYDETVLAMDSEIAAEIDVDVAD